MEGNEHHCDVEEEVLDTKAGHMAFMHDRISHEKQDLSKFLHL